MRHIFFSFVGDRDPDHEQDGTTREGAALDLFGALDGPFDEVQLAFTPGARSKNPRYGSYEARFTALRDRLVAGSPGLRVSAVRLSADPHDARALVRELAERLGEWRRDDVEVHANVSSGTPQMVEAVKVLRATRAFGHDRLNVWQVIDPRHRREGEAVARAVGMEYLEEALRLEAAFEALRRFEYTAAAGQFEDLAERGMESSARTEDAATLRDVSLALAAVDARDATEARRLLGPLGHVDALTDLRDLVLDRGREASLWLIWGRFAASAKQRRFSDALIWAAVLHEAMVYERAEIQSLRAKDDLKANLKMLQEKSVDTAAFDVETNAALQRMRSRRNAVVHRGEVATDEDLALATSAVRSLLEAFSFQGAEAKAWVSRPMDCPVSGSRRERLADDLRRWMR